MGTDIFVSAEGLDFTAVQELAGQVDPAKQFREGRRDLRPKLNRAKMLSRGCGGIPAKNGRTYWATVLFTRMTVISSSILELVPRDEKKDTWDGASICALTRNLAECYLWMFFLATDSVSDEEHEARIYMMYAHDNRGRERIMEEALEDANLAEYYSRVREQIAGKLNANIFFKALSDKRKKELIRGDKTPFVQDDLLDRMGVDRSYFRVVYRVLSAQTHSSPVAFYDVLTVGGGTGTAHEQEMRHIGSALEFAIQLLDWAESDLLSIFPYAERRGKMISASDVRQGKHRGVPIPEMSRDSG